MCIRLCKSVGELYMHSSTSLVPCSTGLMKRSGDVWCFCCSMRCSLAYCKRDVRGEGVIEGREDSEVS